MIEKTIKRLACQRYGKIWKRNICVGCFTARGIGYLYKIKGSIDAALYIQILEKNLLETLNYYKYDINDIIF